MDLAPDQDHHLFRRIAIVKQGRASRHAVLRSMGREPGELFLAETLEGHDPRQGGDDVRNR